MVSSDFSISSVWESWEHINSVIADTKKFHWEAKSPILILHKNKNSWCKYSITTKWITTHSIVNIIWMTAKNLPYLQSSELNES